MARRLFGEPILVIHRKRWGADVLLSGLAFCIVTIVPLVSRYGVNPFLHSSRLFIDVGGYMAAAAIAFFVSGTYRMVWRYVSFRDVFALIRAVSLTCLIYFCGLFFWLVANNIHLGFSRALIAWVVALIWASTLAFVIAPRLISRVIAEHRFQRMMRGPLAAREKCISTLILVGKPERMEAFIRECAHRGDGVYTVAGVFTDDKRLHGSDLYGVKVCGSVGAIPETLWRLKQSGVRPDYLVLADDEAGQDQLERLLDLVAGTDIRVGRLPPLDAFQGEAPVRPIALADLLGRPEIACDVEAVSALVSGKCIMVTGAGGSIGSELCRQVARFEPSKIILLDFGEFNLYSIHRELGEMFPGLECVTALVDVRDASLVDCWIRTTRPDVVFHAAALKHVPLVEEHPIEAVKTNAVGTCNVANACRSCGVRAMVTISTDKAVNPHNVMGATKRLAEAYCQGLDQASRNAGETRFMTVRFGNVLGSAGSVVPLFQHQIEQGGPVTVTDPNITRYFMTISEAVTLVLQAGAHGIDQESERASIYVLDMGEPVKIVDLAAQMIRLSGRRPGIDIEIKIVGLRPGEKLFEEVVHSEEKVEPTGEKSVLKVTPRFTDLRILQQQIQELGVACAGGDRDRVLRMLRLSVPEFAATIDAPNIRHEQRPGTDGG